MALMKLLGQCLIFPFKAAACLIEIVGRTLAVMAGLIGFGIGALCCLSSVFIIIGAPLCLLSSIVVIKAL
jgi:hypothetical protein